MEDIDKRMESLLECFDVVELEGDNKQKVSMEEEVKKISNDY